MTVINLSRFKIIIVVVLIAAFSVALYLRRPKDVREPVWGKGYLSVAERYYYNEHIIDIINRWKESVDQPVDPYNTLLVIDMDKKALWIEENGRIIEDYYIELAPGINWILYYYSTKSTSLQKGKLILKKPDDINALKNVEQLILVGSGIQGNLQFMIIDTVRQLQPGIVNFNPGTFVASMNLNDLGSPFIVTKDVYQQYINSLADSSTIQTDKGNTPAQDLSVLEKNKAAWKKIEKKYIWKSRRMYIKPATHWRILMLGLLLIFQLL